MNIVSALENLFPILAKDKKLALAWAIFIAAVGWTIYFAQAYPAENAKHERFSVELDAINADSEKTMLVYDVTSSVINSSIQVRIYYLENFSEYPYDNVKPETISQGLQQTLNALSEIANVRGTIKGITFHLKELNTYNEGFVEDLTLMENYLKDYEAFYLALIREDKREALSISAKFKSSNAEESISGFQSHLKNFSETTDTELKKVLVDIDESINEISVFNFKKNLTLFAVVYILAFIPIALIYHRRIQNKSKGKKAQKRIANQSKQESKDKK